MSAENNLLHEIDRERAKVTLRLYAIDQNRERLLNTTLGPEQIHETVSHLDSLVLDTYTGQLGAFGLYVNRATGIMGAYQSGHAKTAEQLRSEMVDMEHALVHPDISDSTKKYPNFPVGFSPTLWTPPASRPHTPKPVDLRIEQSRAAIIREPGTGFDLLLRTFEAAMLAVNRYQRGKLEDTLRTIYSAAHTRATYLGDPLAARLMERSAARQGGKTS